MNGFLVVDKPPELTSHDVVAAVRAVTGERKVGHTGTLDPFATGVLALGLGPCTRLMQFLDESIKVYDATIALGAATDTGDPTGEVVREAPVPGLDPDGVRGVLAGFLGERQQVPPPYSAVKHKGKPLYWYARRGEVVEVPARTILVSEVRLDELHADRLRVQITCSKGTYARVLADEIATALGTAGHLSALSRRRSGPFLLEDAIGLPRLAELVAAEPGHTWQQVLLSRGKGERVPWRPRAEVAASLGAHLMRPLDALADLPMLDVDAATARRVRDGAAPPSIPGGVALGGRFVVVDGPDLIAVAEASSRGARSLRVIPANPA